MHNQYNRYLRHCELRPVHIATSAQALQSRHHYKGSYERVKGGSYSMDERISTLS